MGKIYMTACMKGGCAKTVTTYNLAYSLKELGKKVLCVDFDSQANLSTCFGVENPAAVPVTIGHAGNLIEGSTVSWGRFAEVTNSEIIRFGEETGTSEDKRLGAYFVRLNELTKDKFAEKVLKYLWDDAFKMDRYSYFNEGMSSLDSVIEVFREEPASQTDLLKRVLNYAVYAKMIGHKTAETQVSEEELADGE